HAVAAGVVAVVVRVEEDVDLPPAGTCVQPLQERPGRLGELRVHHDDAVAVHQVPDRAAAHGEVPDVAADRREHGLLAGAQQHAGEAGAGEGRGDEPGEGGGQEVTTGRRHDG